MRENIYYWKCDSPLENSEKRGYNDKYEHADISERVIEVCSDVFGSPPAKVATSGSEGNHYGYIVDYPERRYFFRADDGRTEDDYMLAESAVMSLTASSGVPVPEVFHTDVTMECAPFRFQILQMFDEKDLNKLQQRKLLDVEKVAEQLGGILATLHSIVKPGFGFLNTELLQSTNEIVGLNSDYHSYFFTRLDEHIAYLVDNELLDRSVAAEVENAISAAEDALELTAGCLTHRDIAFWNILGTPTEIKAVIDWDDVVIGHPADDFGILTCFYDEDVISVVKRGYETVSPLPAEFDRVRWLHALRNMLWKMMIRHYMGYFEQTGDFFILNDDNRGSLYDFTLRKIIMALDNLRKYG